MNRGKIGILFFMFTSACTAFDIKTPSPSSSANSFTYQIVVDRVFPNSSAARGGLRPGDQILKVDGEKIFSAKGLLAILAKIPSKESSQFTILRNRRKVKLTLVAGKGNYRFGFRFKTPDPEIARQLEFKIWPDEVNPDLKKFTILFQGISMINKNSRSPQKKVFYHLKDLLANKGYFFTDDYDKADFIVQAEFKYPQETASISIHNRRNKNLPFEAMEVFFQERKERKPFLKVSGSLDIEKAKRYY